MIKENDIRVCPYCNELLFIAYDGASYHTDKRYMRLECHNQICDYAVKMSEGEYREKVHAQSGVNLK